MEWVSTTGKSIAEAKEAALDQLGVDVHEAEFEVLEEPRTGLFGRVRGEARVRARILPAQPRPKVERRDRRGKGTKPKGAAGETGPRPPRGTKKATAKAAKPMDKGNKAEKANRGDEADNPGESSAVRTERAPRPGRADRDESIEPAAKSDRTKSASGGRGRSKSASEESRSDDAAPAASTEGNEMTGNDVTVEEQADLTATFLSGLVDSFGLEGKIERDVIDEDTIEVKVIGDDLGLLIGPKGQTLSAIQELSRTYVQRKATGTHYGRVRIDVGGYRARRREALQRFTNQVAEQVLASGVQKALEPMAASDRKVVHDTANDIAGVRTISEGEEPRRRVVIAPE